MSTLSGPIHPISVPDPERVLARSSGESLARFLPGDTGPATLRL